MIYIINSDEQIFQIYGHTTRLPDFRVIGPSENRLESDMADSPDFYISEIRGDRFTDFVFTLPDYREIGSKKSADSKKSGSGTTALGHLLRTKSIKPCNMGRFRFTINKWT